MRARRRLGAFGFLAKTDIILRSATEEDTGEARHFLHRIHQADRVSNTRVTAEEIAQYIKESDGATLLRFDPRFKELTNRNRVGRNFHLCIQCLLDCEIAFRGAWSEEFKAELSEWILCFSAMIVGMAGDLSSPGPTSKRARASRAPTVRAEIILVHGTWSAPRRGSIFRRRRPYWYEPDHQFRTRLGDRLKERGVEWRIDAFTWSGKNSIRERFLASQDLAETISARFGSGVPSVSIVAHSHGGNVALQAVDRLVKSRKKTAFRSRASADHNSSHPLSPSR